jgi:hypothetical protein
MAASDHTTRLALLDGLVIPACPLALTAQRTFDERRQRALIRYYLAAGAGGLAVGVHSTQFAIRDPKIGLFRPVLELAAEELNRSECALQTKEILEDWPVGARQPARIPEVHQGREGRRPVRVAGICGRTAAAVAEAGIARELGYDCALLNLGTLKNASENELLDHCHVVGDVIPLMGFYLQPAAGGRLLPHSFWRRFAQIASVVAIKIAPFNRYQTLDVIRAVTETGREDIALYTGNDDNIVLDLLTPFRFYRAGRPVERRIVGGLLGQWAVWTKRAVELHAECRRLAQSGDAIPLQMLRRSVEVTDANAAIFDAAHGFAGCIPGIHEVLRRQGLLGGTWCLDPNETLSPGQREEIDRVHCAYPHLNDDDFVARHREEWLSG